MTTPKFYSHTFVASHIRVKKMKATFIGLTGKQSQCELEFCVLLLGISCNRTMLTFKLLRRQFQTGLLCVTLDVPSWAVTSDALSWAWSALGPGCQIYVLKQTENKTTVKPVLSNH